MDVLGFHIVSDPSDVPHKVEDVTGKLLSDGFSTTVTDKSGIVRGPFPTVKEAIDAAKAWKKENEDAARAKLRAVEDAAPIAQTVSENPAVQVVATVENPPVVDQTTATDMKEEPKAP